MSYYNQCKPCPKKCACVSCVRVNFNNPSSCCYSPCPSVCPPVCPPVCPCPTSTCTPVSYQPVQYVLQPPCPVPAPCPNVTFITNIATSTAIPSGFNFIPVGTIIPTGSTTVPAGTVTVIIGYTGTPSTNIGGIGCNNGFFTIPVSGRYNITTNICFSATANVGSTDSRFIFIYRVSATTGLVTLLAVDSRIPIAANLALTPTCINVSTEADLNPGDRIFIAAGQTNGLGDPINTVGDAGRLAITRIC